ncbi:NADH-quinone oxidoreductase subunit A [Candidatus Bathyarchaeota archaeon]|nr:NADH-quinone oxidoreductase subunit A [Candidatus Bathyarchaeota archaeon]
MVSAFALILVAVFLIYLAGWLLAPKSRKSEEEHAPYACGERAVSRRVSFNVSLYKFLIYFAILDASVLLVAFAALYAFTLSSLPYLLAYLFIVLTAALILFEGGEK